jgi:acetoin utilization protein AcuC
VPATALVWGDALAGYSFGPDHPLNPRRLELTLALLSAYGLTKRDDVIRVEPRRATDEELLAVHDAAFVAEVRRASGSGRRGPHSQQYGLGTMDVPIVRGMHDAAALVCGATLVAAEEVMSGRAVRAFTIAGGLHHARRAEASGFCIYNDLAVAIRWLQRTHGARVLYLDIDAHHGDGVQWLFYDDPDVLTISLHESGAFLYPGTGYIDELGKGDGYGYSVNVPLDAHTDDASWQSCFTMVVPPLVEAFGPDVIVLQAGCDAHVLDPLTHLRCTTLLYDWIVREVCALAERHCGGRVIMTGGGGYAIYEVVPRAWTLAFAALLGAHVSDALPAEWLAAVRAESGRPVPPTLRDAANAFAELPAQAAARMTNRQTAGAVRQRVLPLVTGWGLAF